MTTLLHELERTGGRYGLQTMCEGGGMANATIIERLRLTMGHRDRSCASSSRSWSGLLIYAARRVAAAEVLGRRRRAEPDPDDVQPVNLRFRCTCAAPRSR